MHLFPRICHPRLSFVLRCTRAACNIRSTSHSPARQRLLLTHHQPLTIFRTNPFAVSLVAPAVSRSIFHIPVVVLPNTNFSISFLLTHAPHIKPSTAYLSLSTPTLRALSSPSNVKYPVVNCTSFGPPPSPLPSSLSPHSPPLSPPFPPPSKKPHLSPLP